MHWGQYDDDLSTPGPIYTKSVANNGPSKLGLSAPVLGLALDPTDHRLFLSDTGNNRVLVYNLDSNDLLLDLLPDNVLGQTNFYSNAAATTQAGMNVPNGLAFDDANNRLFVTQTTGNRVTVYDVASITDGENAVNVLGQATFTATTAATTQAGMNVPYDAAYDSANQRLFVSEGTGNRVKVYDVAAITDGENAVNVLGQATFTATTAATTQAGMNAPRGLAYDSANTRLYVAQATGNRVTTYDVAAITDGENAVNVLGQATFTATTAASTQAGMNAPMGIAFDGTNSRLFVAQTTGNRVTMYDVAAITDGENATGVFGQQNYTASTAAVTRNGLSAPNGVLADPAHNRLYVLDGTANRMVTYNLTTTIANGMNATNVLGQATFTATTAANTQAGMNGPRGLAYDSTNQRLFVSHATSNRVTTYDVTAITDGENATNVIGQADFVSAGAATTQAGINTPAGITYASDILYVTQTTGNRVTMYDVASITNGESAINVLGQPTFTVATASTRQAGLNAPNGVLVDTDNNLLYVLQSGAHRVSIFDTTSIIDGENAVDLLGQFSNDTNPRAPSTSKAPRTTPRINSVFPARKASPSTPRTIGSSSRTARITGCSCTTSRPATPSTTGSPMPSSDKQTSGANAVATTQNGLSSPTGLAFDSAHNRLYVSDLTNNRIVFYDTASITDGENAIGVLGQPSFLVATAATTQLGLSGVRLLYHDTALRPTVRG
jgi:DNA-binding beta-propeller fold protein YncE